MTGFAEEGARLVLIDLLDCTATVQAVRQVYARGGQRAASDVEAFQCDVSDEAAVAALGRTVATQFGLVVHGLVCSQAAFVFRSVENAVPSDWQKSFNVNVVGSALLMKAFLPGLKNAKQHGGGSVVLLGSISSFLAQSNCATYSVTKAALVQLAKNSAYDLAPYGIRVNSVCPGTIETPISVTERAEQKLTFAEWEKLKTTDVMLGRVGRIR
jgi:2-keto-3-deoxy-L-fuconate dehydrogenase